MDTRNIHNCLEILYKKPKWFFQKENIAEKLQCFDTIQDLGTPSIINNIIPSLKNDNIQIKEKAVQTIVHLFKKLNSLNDYFNTIRYLNIDKHDLDLYKISFDEETYLHLLEISSLNQNGYVREMAVTELGRLKNPAGLKFILIRLGDWVVQVRKAAEKAISLFLDTSYVDHFLEQLPTINWLLNIKRVDLTNIYTRIIQFILNHNFSDEFLNKVNQLNEKSRSFFYKIFFSQAHVSIDQVNKIIKDRNFTIRLEVLKHLSLFDEDFKKELIGHFLQDNSARIRVNALYASIPYVQSFEDIINVLVSDEAASVRELSRHLLKGRVQDFRDIYKERINKKQFLSGSIMGLSELGKAEDVSIFEEYIHSKKNSITISCLIAISKFNDDKSKYYALEFINHSSSKARKKAREILAKNFDNSILEKVREIYRIGDSIVRESILNLYSKIGGWLIVGDLLLALADGNTSIQNLSWRLLERWKLRATRLFTIPSKLQLDTLHEIFDNLDTTKLQMTDSRANLLKDLKFYIRE